MRGRIILGLVGLALLAVIAYVISSRMQEGEPPLQSNYKQVTEYFHSLVSADPDLAKALAGLPYDEAKKLNQVGTHVGLYWLSSADLEDWARLQLEMANISEDSCVKQTAGHFQQGDLERTIDALPLESGKKLFYLKYKAMKAYVLNGRQRNESRVQEEFGKSIDELNLLFPDKSRKTIREMYLKPDENTRADNCWLTKTMWGPTPGWSPEMRENYLRNFSSL